jgi:beta-galactosidase
VDAAGNPAPRAHDRIQFTVEGPGEIAATDNGDPTDFDPFPSTARNAFNGQALVVIRTQAGRPGAIRVSAESGALGRASVTVQSVGPRR